MNRRLSKLVDRISGRNRVVDERTADEGPENRSEPTISAVAFIVLGGVMSILLGILGWLGKGMAEDIRAIRESMVRAEEAHTYDRKDIDQIKTIQALQNGAIEGHEHRITLLEATKQDKVRQ